MPKKSAAAAKVDSTPSPGRRSSRTEGVSQPGPDVPRRITRSTCKPGDLVAPGGAGSFRDKIHESRPTAADQAEARVSQTTIPLLTTGLAQDQILLPSIETAETRPRTSEPDNSGSAENDSTGTSDYSAENDLEAFYKRIGYLAPLDDATIEVLEFLSLSYPNMDTNAGRISASKLPKLFRTGLEEYRNVETRPTEPGKDDIDKGTSSFSTATEGESQAVRVYQDELWEHDLEKCSDEFSEKIFQRTILMAMIDRCRLIYPTRSDDSAKKPLLDFAVENLWNCPPMPTKAARKCQNLLTRPLPDLAVAFRRESLFSSDLDWDNFPSATRKIMCYEGIGGEDTYRAFHFLTIEAKRSYTGVDDRVAIYQSLNNASQALHNMYEFFREADMGIDGKGNDRENGNKYRKIFFDNVRFFSVVATAGAMKIRIHRACLLDPKVKPIVKGYPLEFKFADYMTIGGGGKLARQMVVEELAKILLGYGVGQLALHLKSAIKEIHGKFQDHRRDEQDFPRKDDFYSHGLYEGLMALSSKRRLTTASARPTGDSETGSKTPTNAARNSQHPSSHLQSFGASQLQINVDALSTGQPEASQSGNPSRNIAASQQEDSDTGRGRGKKRKITKKSTK